jgi:hypothetical protein
LEPITDPAEQAALEKRLRQGKGQGALAPPEKALPRKGARTASRVLELARQLPPEEKLGLVAQLAGELPPGQRLSLMKQIAARLAPATLQRLVDDLPSPRAS